MHSRGHKETSVHPSCPRASDNKILGAEIINANMRSKSQPYGTEFTIHIHMFFRRSARRARLLSTRKLRTPAPAHHTLRRARRLCRRKAAGTGTGMSHHRHSPLSSPLLHRAWRSFQHQTMTCTAHWHTHHMRSLHPASQITAIRLCPSSPLHRAWRSSSQRTMTCTTRRHTRTPSQATRFRAFTSKLTTP